MAAIATDSVRALIRDALENTDDHDPRTIARLVAESLEAHELRRVVEPLLVAEVRNVMHDARRHPGHLASARWQDAAEDNASGAAALLRVDWCVNGEWIPLAKIDHAAAMALHADYLDRAAANAAQAVKFKRLASHLSNGMTAADLPAATLLAIFNA